MSYVEKMKKLYHRENIFKIAVPILTVFLILLSMEFFAWAHTELFSISTNAFAFRIKQPAPYKNAEYFSKEFVMEAFYQPATWKNSGTYRIPGDFKGRFFNTSGGLRATSFQPVKFKHTVHVFGGSTIYSAEVPDEHTIASYIQSYFNERYPQKYIVKNYGLPTISIQQQLQRLKTVNVKKNDIVIFYDGVNEINLNIFYANPDSSLVRITNKNMNAMSWIQTILFHLSYSSYFVRLFMSPINYAVPEHLNDKQFIDKMVEKTTLQFKKNIKDAYRYSTERNAVFFHFLQPHLFADDKLTEYEKKLCRNKYLIPLGFDKSFKTGYPELQKAAEQLPEKYNNFDITHILDKRPAKEEFFLDHMHVNHLGNKKIAKKIFDTVSKVKKQPDRTQQLHLSLQFRNFQQEH